MIRPLSGSMSRLIMRSVVVLPHPDGPMSTQVCSSGISSVRFSTAFEPPGNCLVTFSSSITALSRRTWLAGRVHLGRHLTFHTNAPIRGLQQEGVPRGRTQVLTRDFLDYR